MENPVILAGIALIFIGIVVLAAGIMLQGGNSGVRGGAVVFIGPVPMAFGTDRGSLMMLSVMMIAMMLLYFLFFGGFRFP